MWRSLGIFVFGLVTGVALLHFLEGPLNLGILKQEAGEALQQAGRSAADLQLEGKVRAALALQKDFELFGGISVEVDGDDITLTGTVGTEDQKRLAELISRGVDGVDRVDNDLEIHQPLE